MNFLEKTSEIYNEIPNAEIGIFIPPSGIETPIIPCVILDEEAVNFGWGYLGRARMDEVNITLRQPEAVEAFSAYFAVLWQKAHILKERGQKIDATKLNSLKQSLDEPDVDVQSTLEEAYSHLIETYMASETSISNISWKNLQVVHADPLRKQYFDGMFDLMKNTPYVSFRRLLWDPEHLAYLEDTVGIYNDIPSAEIRYFNQLEELETPIMPCTIVDEKIVDFGWEYLGSPQMDVVNITARKGEIVEAFNRYFSYLWQKSIPLKERNKPVDKAAIKQLRKQLRNRGLHQ